MSMIILLHDPRSIIIRYFPTSFSNLPTNMNLGGDKDVLVSLR